MQRTDHQHGTIDLSDSAEHAALALVRSADVSLAEEVDLVEVLHAVEEGIRSLD